MRLCEENITLTGKAAALELLSIAHHEDLVEAVQDGDLHKLWYTNIPSACEMRAEISRRLELHRQGSMYPFALKHLAKQRCVGMTTYMNIEPSQRRLEIGSTRLRKSIQRSAVNTECKFLLLEYAFEHLNCICVEFRTHTMNLQSRRAIERLGAKQDGILRNNMIMANGSYRDSAVYSIIASEWPSVKANLTWQLQQYA